MNDIKQNKTNESLDYFNNKNVCLRNNNSQWLVLPFRVTIYILCSQQVLRRYRALMQSSVLLWYPTRMNMNLDNLLSTMALSKLIPFLFFGLSLTPEVSSWVVFLHSVRNFVSGVSSENEDVL